MEKGKRRILESRLWPRWYSPNQFTPGSPPQQAVLLLSLGPLYSCSCCWGLILSVSWLARTLMPTLAVGKAFFSSHRSPGRAARLQKQWSNQHGIYKQPTQLGSPCAYMGPSSSWHILLATTCWQHQSYFCPQYLRSLLKYDLVWVQTDQGG